MKKLTYKFSTASTFFYFDTAFADLKTIVDKQNAVVITDENVFANHEKKLKGWNVIVLKAGEAYKIQPTVDTVIEQLIAFGADRKTFLAGIGGGVITDITGYVAAIYMRGLRFGFIPTTILAMVDAAIGGKNGIDVGVYKNMVGTIRQPEFLLYDYSLLKSLPESEWINGFAEIIKHACIKDARMFKLLEEKTLANFQKNKTLLSALIQTNVKIKAGVVQRDEFEQGERRLLNYGHTLGHAVENMYELGHGQAISIGMTTAAMISKKLLGFKQSEKVIALLSKYGLPTVAEYDKEKAFEILTHDKKKVRNEMNYILLEKIGKGVVRPIPLNELKTLI
ncbi:3-dehydroquinate synthase [Pinibacter soli]|uniref:3-dehydroquinate synthase n=1 Tax=Pinibacter soli TaxID=3044211 RepID=A0ABT6RAR8_9BACT|nr:3-dehydroquinate synthase [Pinibacter soli]MDI3319643.1 3-dehydroquinate synthase [Pinibacter soli]